MTPTGRPNFRRPDSAIAGLDIVVVLTFVECSEPANADNLFEKSRLEYGFECTDNLREFQHEHCGYFGQVFFFFFL